MKTIVPLIKNSLVKKILRKTGIRKPFVRQAKSDHYRMPVLEDNGGFLLLKKYNGPAIPKSEWEDLEYITYPSDPNTFFAPLASANGKVEMSGFWEEGKTDKDGIWTANAKKAPHLKKWVESMGVNFGRVQLLRQEPNSLREARWGLHLDDNNRLNKKKSGWVVRIWLQLTDDPSSSMVLRKNDLSRSEEVRIPLPQYSQLVVDSEYLFHGVHHGGTKTRYGLIVSGESGPKLEKWIKSQLPDEPQSRPKWLDN